MANVIRSLVPLAHVRDVNASIAFYRHLGFEVRNTHVPAGHGEPVWAWLTSGRAQVMLSLASGPVDAGQQAVLFYAYCDDVESMREQVMAAGIAASEIAYPFYSSRGEFKIHDPDGYLVIVSHT